MSQGWTPGFYRDGCLYLDTDAHARRPRDTLTRTCGGHAS